MTVALGAGRVPTWRIVNISPTEPVGRVTIGVAAAIAGVLFLTTASSVLAVVLEVARCWPAPT